MLKEIIDDGAFQFLFPIRKNSIGKESEKQKIAGFDSKRKLERKGSSLIDNLDTYPMVTFRNVSIDKVAICTHNIEKEKDKNLQ